MPKPVCVKCGLFFRVKRNGFLVEEGMPSGGEPVRWVGINPKDNDRERAWSSYKLWQGDLWECRGCGVQIVSGFGHNPWAEHYQPHYEALRTANGEDDILFVHDC